MNAPPEDFDRQIRSHLPAVPGLPAGFRASVWRQIRSRHKGNPEGSPGPLLADLCSLRLAAAASVCAIALSTILGVLVGNATVSKPQENLFSHLTSAPGISFAAQ